jgi:hypothetical protein
VIPNVVQYFVGTGLSDLLDSLDLLGVLLFLLWRRVNDLVELLLQILENALDLPARRLDFFVKRNAFLG